MWNVESTIQLMQALSLSANADELLRVLGHHVRHAISVDRALILDRLDLVEPQYRVARRADWDASQNQFVETQPQELRQGGLLSGVPKCPQ